MTKEASPSENPKNVVNSVGKAFSVLQAFRPEQPVMSVSEVAAGAGLDRGTAFRLLHTLASLGYVRTVPGKRFRLALKCLDLGYSALASHELWDHAGPLLEECVPEVADAASLAVVDGNDIVYLKRYDTPLGRHRADARPGRKVSNHAAALAHAILAWMPEEKQIELLESEPRIKFSEKTLTELPDLLARLKLVREQGYAASDGENAYGLRTVAVPILDTSNSPVAGVSLTVDAARMPMSDLIRDGVPKAKAISVELSKALTNYSGAAAGRLPV
ncbi:IclR family transcriptional regulator C-terminal domain-containing protein [Sinomonas sp. JGH33]|uniref:IclR family transcriptional regulator C-terminal domain-containing protein n=1 Tax=Sinomonas terricola TaxID=3110330 RepID=A0ABU5TBJ4_9MICC|nr:IclR family transcriptional regulator C-terminal domain-containing protein [Sinomonas sp. JGH33]MEA5457015.1 IclR family transcriptional regulator C-terminal domain-containing protein [Sinomonas sp. JGH33]